MKLNKAYLTFAAFLLVILTGCSNTDETKSHFDNVAYITQATTINTDNLTLKSSVDVAEKKMQVSLALPESEDITVRFKTDPSLVSVFNASNYVEYETLPQKYYSISANEVVIAAGDVRSPEVTVTFSGLDEMPRNITYVLPVTLESASNGVSILDGSRTLYYIVKKGAIINTAANMAENYLEVPGFGPSSPVQGLTKLTFEALIKPNSPWNGISSIMGVEGYFLIRFGDTFVENQVQLAHTNGNIGGPLFQANKWQHFAMTYDYAAKQLIFYLDGEQQGVTNNFTFAYPVINLGANQNNDRAFFLGYSYANGREFNGEMSEVRIWNVVRTQEEIAQNFYEVDPDAEGLVSYWKFDEGAGNTVKDHTANGNDATAVKAVTWISVELPIEE